MESKIKLNLTVDVDAHTIGQLKGIAEAAQVLLDKIAALTCDVELH